MSLEEKAQQASGEYQKVQVSLTNAIQMRERLEAQLSENELVKKVSTGTGKREPNLTDPQRSSQR
jgi:chaperonin cofactor prefoldin